MSIGRAVPYFYGKFRFRNWSCRSWTISCSGGAKVTSVFAPSDGVVDWVSRAAVTEHVVLTAGLHTLQFQLSNPYYDNVWELLQLLIRLPKQTNEYLRIQSTSTNKLSDSNGAIHDFRPQQNFVSRGYRCSPKKQWRRQLVGTWTRAPPPWRLRIFFAIRWNKLSGLVWYYAELLTYHYLFSLDRIWV